MVIEERGTHEVRCSFCAGRGKDQFGIMSRLSACSVCGGRTTVVVQAPYARCAHRKGAGTIKRLTCTVCRGTGFGPAKAGPTVVCPTCRGSGDDLSAPAMACLRCRGRGWLRAAAEPEGPHPMESQKGAVA